MESGSRRVGPLLMSILAVCKKERYLLQMQKKMALRSYDSLRHRGCTHTGSMSRVYYLLEMLQKCDVHMIIVESLEFRKLRGPF